MTCNEQCQLVQSTEGTWCTCQLRQNQNNVLSTNTHHLQANSHIATLSGVFRGGALCEGPPPFGRTAVIFVTNLGLFLAPFRDKIAATSDQMRFFWPENALKCVCGRGSAPNPAGGAYSAPSAANLFTVDSRRVVPAR